MEPVPASVVAERPERLDGHRQPHEDAPRPPKESEALGEEEQEHRGQRGQMARPPEQDNRYG